MNRVLLYRMRLLCLGLCSAAGAFLALRGFAGPWAYTAVFVSALLSIFSQRTGTRGGTSVLLTLAFLCLGMLAGGIEASRYRGREGGEEEVVVRGRVVAQRGMDEGDYLLLEVREVVRGSLPRRGDVYLLGRGRDGASGGVEEENEEGGKEAPGWGDELWVAGNLRIFSRVEGEVGGILRPGQWRREAGPGAPWRRWAASFRRVMLDERWWAGREESLIRGMALGDYRHLGAGELRDLRASGLLHVCAASGLHVTLLSALLVWGMWKAGVGRRLSRVMALPFLFTYALAVGSTPSVRRAVVMAALSATAFLVGRKPDPVAALGAALVMGVLCSPRAILSTGFLLSYSAASGMIILYPVLRDRWGRGLPRPLKPVLPSLAAQLAVAPVMLGRFGGIPLLAPVSNALALPLLPFILFPALLLGIVGVFWPPAAGLGFALARPFCRLFFLVAEGFGAAGRRLAVPLYLPAFGVFLLCLFMASWCLTRGRVSRLAAWGTVALLALALAWNLPAAAGFHGRGAPSVTYFDVGQGDSALLVGPKGELVLLDGGPDPFLVKKKLAARGLRYLDAVIYSHGDRDHVEGLVEVIAELQVGVLMRPAMAPGAGAEREVLEAAMARGVPVVELGGGERVAVGELVLEVVGGPSLLDPGAETGDSPKGSPRNEASLVVSVELEGVTFLFPGDIEEVGQGYLLEGGHELKADVLKLPHHGGFAANTESFLDEVDPRAAIISVGTPNEYGHPSAGTLRSLERRGCRVFRTDESGDIVVRASKGRVMVQEENAPTRKKAAVKGSFRLFPGRRRFFVAV